MTTTPYFTLGHTLALGSLAGLTYAVFEGRRLVSRYPLHYGSSAPPSSAALWPAGLIPPVEVRALTRIPRGTDPRETFLAAFYDTWTLRVEGFAHRNFGVGSVNEPLPVVGLTPKAVARREEVQHDREFASRPPAAPYTPPPTPATPDTPGTPTPTPEALPTGYASGLFPVIGRTAECTMVFWGSIKSAGGAQLFTCIRVPNSSSKTEQVQISYTCAETPFLKDGTVLGWIGTKFHHMYMRYLLDRAAVRMEGWAAAAEGRQ